MNLEYHINIDKYSWYWIYLPDWERIKHFKRQRICVEKPNHKCDFGPPPKRWWNEENPCQYVSHKIWSSSSFLNIQKYVYQSETKIGFQKKTLVSTLVSFNPRNVLSVFRLILVHGKITHPDSADEVLDLFFKGETPPHVSADGYWNFSVKLEIHPMVLSKKKTDVAKRLPAFVVCDKQYIISMPPSTSTYHFCAFVLRLCESCEGLDIQEKNKCDTTIHWNTVDLFIESSVVVHESQDRLFCWFHSQTSQTIHVWYIYWFLA